MVKIDLENRTVKNTGETAILLTELIVKVTSIEPGETVILDPMTKAIEL